MSFENNLDFAKQLDEKDEELDGNEADDAATPATDNE